MRATPIAGRRSGRRSPTAPHGKPWVFRTKDLRGWWENQHFNRPGGVESGAPTAWVPQSKPIVFTEAGCPAVDRGTNQPNVFFDPKSSESFLPHFSRGWRDDADPARLHRGDLGLVGHRRQQPDLLGLRRPHGAGRGLRRLDLGRAALSVLPRARGRLDRRAELAARALADRPARRGRRSPRWCATSAAAPACPRTASTSPASGARSRAASSPRSKARAPRSPRSPGTSASTPSRARA